VPYSTGLPLGMGATAPATTEAKARTAKVAKACIGVRVIEKLEEVLGSHSSRDPRLISMHVYCG
jgi:hypothetical protein